MSKTPATYTPLARFFHWSVALAVFAAIPLAFMADDAAPEVKGQLFFWHKSIGVLVLALVVLRALHRVVQGVPFPHFALSKFERLASRAMHWMLYVLVFAIPVLGWYGTSAYGRPPSFFGLFTLPSIAPENRELGGLVMDVHVAVAFALIFFVAGHVFFALYHAIVKRDGVLTRMVTGKN